MSHRLMAVVLDPSKSNSQKQNGQKDASNLQTKKVNFKATQKEKPVIKKKSVSENRPVIKAEPKSPTPECPESEVSEEEESEMLEQSESESDDQGASPTISQSTETSRQLQAEMMQTQAPKVAFRRKPESLFVPPKLKRASEDSDQNMDAGLNILQRPATGGLESTISGAMNKHLITTASLVAHAERAVTAPIPSPVKIAKDNTQSKKTTQGLAESEVVQNNKLDSKAKAGTATDEVSPLPVNTARERPLPSKSDTPPVTPKGQHVQSKKRALDIVIPQWEAVLKKRRIELAQKQAKRKELEATLQRYQEMVAQSKEVQKQLKEIEEAILAENRRIEGAKENLEKIAGVNGLDGLGLDEGEAEAEDED